MREGGRQGGRQGGREVGKQGGRNTWNLVRLGEEGEEEAELDELRETN